LAVTLVRRVETSGGFRPATILGPLSTSLMLLLSLSGEPPEGGHHGIRLLIEVHFALPLGATLTGDVEGGQDCTEGAAITAERAPSGATTEAVARPPPIAANIRGIIGVPPAHEEYARLADRVVVRLGIWISIR
jgi:hypothetical protein